jgi:hypothetical protein
MEGLEPPHLTASDPKSDVSTNFTTSGKSLFRVEVFEWLLLAILLKRHIPNLCLWGCKCRAFYFIEEFERRKSTGFCKMYIIIVRLEDEPLSIESSPLGGDEYLQLKSLSNFCGSLPY